MSDEKTVEDIAQDYFAMGHSVDLINEYRESPPEHMTEEEVADAIDRNVRHLEIMLAKDYWTDEDLSAATAAVGGE